MKGLVTYPSAPRAGKRYFTCAPGLLGQQQSVSGKITDDTGEPVPGANIVIKGTTSGTVSDFEGNYTLNASSEDILVYSSVGFLSQEVVVGTKSVIDLVLTDDIRQLEELVVTGTLPHAKSWKPRFQSVLTIESSYSSILPNVLSRPPESVPLRLVPGENLQLRIFIDKSVVEVFANGKQCVAMRVYPGLEESVGVSLRSQGKQSKLLSLDAWQMRSIY